MANKYWVGAPTSSWSPSALPCWSLTSGGPASATNPTANDDVFFDANSGGSVVSVINGPLVCRGLSLLGFAGSLQLASPLSVGGNLELGDHVNPDSGVISSTGGILRMNGMNSRTIKSNGKSLFNCSLRLENGAGFWALLDKLHLAGSGSLDMRSGHFDTAGHEVKIEQGDFSLSVGSASRWVTLGASKLTLGRGLRLPNTGTSFNAGTSIIEFVGSNAGLLEGGSPPRAFHEVNFRSGTGPALISGGVHTFQKLAVSNPHTDLTLGNNIGVQELIASGDSPTDRVRIASNVPGTQRTITAGSVALSNVAIQDILAAGVSAPWSGTDLDDQGGNSGINF